MGLPILYLLADSAEVGLFFVCGAAVPRTRDRRDLSYPTLAVSSHSGWQAEATLTPGAAGESELAGSKLDAKT